jgi:CRISPR/Cas system CSM-associated protein Csm2 small subunit
MTKRATITADVFVRTFAAMAMAGHSALEIGRALGMEGDDDKVSSAVSVKASQLRQRFRKAALKIAAKQKLSEEDTAKLVESMGSKLPTIKSRGRKSNVESLTAAIDEVLSKLG